MKSLFFLAAFTLNLSVFPTNDISYANANDVGFAEADVTDFIVMDDDVMLVSTSPTNGHINDIQVFDSNSTLVNQNSGCNDSECNVDLSSLTSGRYSVTVKTTTSYTFSGSIEVQ